MEWKPTINFAPKVADDNDNDDNGDNDDDSVENVTINWAPEEEMLGRRSWETSTEKGKCLN